MLGYVNFHPLKRLSSMCVYELPTYGKDKVYHSPKHFLYVMKHVTHVATI